MVEAAAPAPSPNQIPGSAPGAGAEPSPNALRVTHPGCRRTSRRTLLLAATLTPALLHAAGQEPPTWAVLEDTRLVDPYDRPVSRASFSGFALLMNFVFTQCSAVCPVQTRELAEVIGSLPPDVRRRTRFLSISLDPLSDTPAMLRAFAQRHQALLPGWTFATGSAHDIERVTARLRVLPSGEGAARIVNHTAHLHLFDGQGLLRQRYGGLPVDQARLADDITRLVRSEAIASRVA